jgi:transcriptional regulator with XRE-family HTH domain
MVIHIGKKIKEELYNQKISVSVFAKKINRSRNVVYDIFERESIDTDLLNKISRVLNCDFFSVYSSQKEYAPDKVKNFNVNDPAILYGKHNEEVDALKQQNQILLNEISYLKKIISLLEDKKQPKIKIKA